MPEVPDVPRTQGRDAATAPWWAPLQIPSGRTAVLHLGPLTLRLYRSGDEWLLGAVRAEEVDEGSRAEVELAAGRPDIAAYERYVYRSAEGRAAFRPLLADRPVVIRPRQPVFVLPGEETTFYISTPVWVGVAVGETPVVLRELPVLRLSDTWFGPSTREGELCYAARTHARSGLDEVPLRAHRAVTPVRIQNRADTQLPVEKLSLPVPLLSVYGRQDGSLWTESVRLMRATDSDMAALKVEPGPPSYAAGAVLLGGPRGQPEKTGLVRAFSGLFG